MSNLPPGVSVSDIPGNRPEDEWWDKFHESIAVPDELVSTVDPVRLAEIVSNFLGGYKVLWSSAFTEGFQEGKMTQIEEDYKAATGDET